MGMSVEQIRLELYELKEELQRYGAASADCLCPESILLLLFSRRSSYGGDELFYRCAKFDYITGPTGTVTPNQAIQRTPKVFASRLAGSAGS